MAGRLRARYPDASPIPLEAGVRLIGFSPRRPALTGAGALLVAGLLTAATPTAQAAPAHPAATLRATVSTVTAATTVAGRLGAHSAGAYRDRATGAMVVTVTDAAAARTARAAGATPRLVARGSAVLANATATLRRDARIPGTAWATDPVSDQVVVSVDRSVTPSGLARLTAVTRGLGDAVRVRHVAGRFATRISGGDAIWGAGYRCSLGFNVTDGSSNYFVTAGHCGNDVSAWYADQGESEYIGPTVSATFPGHDYALVHYEGSVQPSPDVDLYDGSTQPISAAADAYVGESVQRSGSTSGLHGGSVQALNATVNYQEGEVDGLIQTDVCAEPGDSGGSLFDGGNALGLTSGGDGDCSSGGTTFFQPVTDALSAYGMHLL